MENFKPTEFLFKDGKPYYFIFNRSFTNDRTSLNSFPIKESDFTQCSIWTGGKVRITFDDDITKDHMFFVPDDNHTLREFLDTAVTKYTDLAPYVEYIIQLHKIWTT